MSRFAQGHLVTTAMIFFIKWPWALCHLGYSDHSKTEEDQNYSRESSIISLLKGEKERKKKKRASSSLLSPLIASEKSLTLQAVKPMVMDASFPKL